MTAADIEKCLPFKCPKCKAGPGKRCRAVNGSLLLDRSSRAVMIGDLPGHAELRVHTKRQDRYIRSTRRGAQRMTKKTKKAEFMLAFETTCAELGLAPESFDVEAAGLGVFEADSHLMVVPKVFFELLLKRANAPAGETRPARLMGGTLQ